jgi:hypothetical protein
MKKDGTPKMNRTTYAKDDAAPAIKEAISEKGGTCAVCDIRFGLSFRNLGNGKYHVYHNLKAISIGDAIEDLNQPPSGGSGESGSVEPIDIDAFDPTKLGYEVIEGSDGGIVVPRYEGKYFRIKAFIADAMMKGPDDTMNLGIRKIDPDKPNKPLRVGYRTNDAIVRFKTQVLEHFKGRLADNDTVLIKALGISRFDEAAKAAMPKAEQKAAESEHKAAVKAVVSKLAKEIKDIDKETVSFEIRPFDGKGKVRSSIGNDEDDEVFEGDQLVTSEENYAVLQRSFANKLGQSVEVVFSVPSFYYVPSIPAIGFKTTLDSAMYSKTRHLAVPETAEADVSATEDE